MAMHAAIGWVGQPEVDGAVVMKTSLENTEYFQKYEPGK